MLEVKIKVLVNYILKSTQILNFLNLEIPIVEKPECPNTQIRINKFRLMF